MLKKYKFAWNFLFDFSIMQFFSYLEIAYWLAFYEFRNIWKHRIVQNILNWSITDIDKIFILVRYIKYENIEKNLMKPLGFSYKVSKIGIVCFSAKVCNKKVLIRYVLNFLCNSKSFRQTFINISETSYLILMARFK